jgi:HNH endonuclease
MPWTDIPPVDSAQRREEPPSSYRAYLNSPHWRVRRNRALNNAGWRCQRCGSQRDLQVHHRSYQRLGAEWDSDLEVLCFDCHNGHHQDEAKYNELGIYLKLVSVVLQRDPFAQIADIANDVKQLCADKKIQQKTHLIDKAISMACGTRLKDKQGRPYVSVAECDEIEISHAQALELFKRLDAVGLGLIRTMPGEYGGNGPEHEAKVLEQARQFRNLPSREKRRPLIDRLAYF